MTSHIPSDTQGPPHWEESRPLTFAAGQSRVGVLWGDDVVITLAGLRSDKQENVFVLDSPTRSANTGNYSQA